MMAMKRKMLWLDEEIDAAAIQTIRTRYGVESESAAMRLALRVLANSPMLTLDLPERPTHARRSPKDAAPAE
jgi:Arc/MetJ family transcription regulator